MTETSTATATPADLDALVADYVASWNAHDGRERQALVEKVWATDARSVDPLGDVTGHDAISAMIGGLQEQHPGLRCELTSGLDTHHDQLRFAWRFVDPDGNTAIEGIDAVRLTADGRRFQHLAGFFGPLT